MKSSVPTSPHEGPPPGALLLTVYENRFCGYCMDVRQVLAELDLDVTIRSIADNPRYRSELIRGTGSSTVPVLKIEQPDGSVSWLPESRDIIAFLYARAGVEQPRLRLRPYTLLRALVVLALLTWALGSRWAAWF
jgi:glutaredoxin